MTPLTFAALLGLLVLFIFFVIGAYQFRQIRTYDAFYLRSRDLEGGEYASSFAASSTSFATVMIWFIAFGSSEGLPLLYCALTYFIGAWVFTLFTPVIAKHDFFTKGHTLGEFMYRLYESRAVAISISLVAATGLLCILLIELYVGATLFSIYSKANVPGAIPIGVAVLAICVFGYSALGGFPGVVRSDKVQMLLILTAGAAVPLILWIDPPTTSVFTADRLLPSPLVSWPDDPLSNGRLIISLPLFVNLLFVNILVFPAQMRQWQMAAACKSPADMRSGLIKGGIVNTVAWGMFILLGVLVGLHYPVAPGETPNFDGILTMLSSSDSFVVSYVAFPLLFIACLAALLSTADSAIIPLSQAITDDCLDEKYHTVWVGRVVILTLALFALALYYVAFVYLRIDFMNLLFTLWGLLIVLAPAIGFAMLLPTMAKATRGKVAGFCSIWVGLILTLGIIIFATPGDGPEWLAWYPKGQPGVLYAGPIGVIASGLIVALGLSGQGRAVSRANEPTI